jgi:carbon monoxide dehydrogenase subunit G
MLVTDSSSGNSRGLALPFHFECSVLVNAPAEAVFSRLDDPRLLSAHMSGSSWMMAGSRMALELDASQGRAVGAPIRMGGRVLGMALSLEEIVTERNPPQRKVWETTGAPRLLVIGHYRMGYDLTPQGDSSLLRVFIDYAFPEGGPSRWLGRMFGGYYARWCTERMAADAAEHFRAAGRGR